MPTEELSPEELSHLLSSYMPDIPGYRVIRRIGKGGMSYVYLGVQVSLDRQVAIKVMSPEALTDEKSKQRFEQEAHTIAKLEHPCIVGIHEVGRTQQGLLYYVLPYLARGHLGQRDFTNDESRIIEVLRALLSALDYAHTRGIVHRDVKAENVLFDNADRPLLTDFGIALSRTDTSRITTAGLAVGSGGYMSPEQARGEAVDGRADLYSVGVLAYELLNGRLPYLSSDPLGLALMHAQDPVPRLPAERRHWQHFIDRAMAKSPENRYRNAQQMLGALSQVMSRERPLPGEAPVEALLPVVARPWLRPAIFALAGAVSVLGVIAIMRPGSGPAPAPTDFFTGNQAAVHAAPSKREPAALAGAAPSQPTAPAAPAPTAPSPPVPTPSVLGSGSAYTNVFTHVSVVPLAFDPAQPGARELHAASRQVAHNRLSTPAGDNAMESIAAARQAGATEASVASLSDEVIAGLGVSLHGAIKSGNDESAGATWRRVQQFATQGKRLESDAWKQLREPLPGLLSARLVRSADKGDANGVARSRALARNLQVQASELEPAWSRTVEAAAQPRLAASPSAGGPSLVPLPRAARAPGVAVMREEVSRAQYAQFASSTNRPVSKCRNRLAPITMKKRTWVAPGFEQTGGHPAVCVSYQDAAAYAQWLSQRTGERYRLPSATEWRSIANYRGSGNACADGRLDCGPNGTVPANQGPSSPLGLHGVRGNAREWLSDCNGGCRQRLVSGLGWRDKANRADPMRSSGFDATVGFDDVGFRLVRESSPD